MTTPRVVIKFPKAYRKADCQGERRPVPAAKLSDQIKIVNAGRNSVWGRSMMDTVFQAIEHDEGLEAAIEAFRRKINQYDQNEVA